MPSGKVKFTDGERVLCFHGPLLYEAKCTKTQMKDKQIKHFIHYNGWNKNWDEWVPEGRVLKFNDANLQKQKELLAAHKAKAKKARLQKKPQDKGEKERSSTPSAEKQASKKAKQEATKAEVAQATPEATPESGRKKRATRGELNVESEESFLNKVEVKVRIPEELKPILVDDWDLITKQKMLLHLPAKHNVDSIIEDYIKHKRTKTATKESIIIEVTQGLKEYFNVMLGTQLLYKFERAQYADILSTHQESPMSKVYGAQHFLRLFVKLGGLLAFTTLDEKSMSLLLTNVHDFLKFLLKNSSTYFNNSDYEVASPEYQRKAM
ncbi:putative mortality factor 4-like protein 1-like isoform X2 [Apostichopus japonicus]|uniref:Mortality factor 4-like protein 1 n=1 Tax=Stichopus japonicus TaxID=307972 RepID=A0A2G8LPJ2_STIJA|nr:putative mortality factor 4-like protein 1-like isoform X2 [Apostichopus japonicus]